MVADKNFLDRIVSFLSPQAGARRARFRLVESEMVKLQKRRYDGASRGRRTAGWATSGSSANTEIQSSLVTLRDRSRDLTRNDVYASRAVQVITSNVIGTGIVAQPKSKRAVQLKNARDLWRAWAETPACDYDGQRDFYGIQSLIMRTVAESGECLVRKIRMRSKDKLPVPLQLQVIEGDYLDHTRTSQMLADGGYIIQGIEFGPDGKRRGYWLYNHHPGDPGIPPRSLMSQFYPAADVLHIYRADRPGQVRGVPWGASAILKIKDFNDYEDAQLTRQKIAACFSAFIYDSEPPVNDIKLSDDDSGDLLERVEPGLIQYLPQGKDIKFGNPPGADGYGEYSKNVLRGIAMGFGVPYEALTGDLSNVNFSSGRMGWLEFQRNIDQWRWHLIIPQACEGVWKWFQEAADLVGANIDDVRAGWTAPRREMINPTEEVKANLMAIRTGQKTPQEVIRENGGDPQEMLDEYSEWNKMLDSRALVFDSDPRKINAAGAFQQSTSDNSSNSGGSET